MGFFSKVFKKIKKGVKSAFKSIGKGIKSAFKKIGKFMGKIGIVGQLALMFTPIGAMLGSAFSSIGSAVGGAVGKGITALTSAGNPILKGAGKVLEAGYKFAKGSHAAFRTVTDGVSSFIKEFSKTALKKIPGMSDLMPKFLGDSASDTFFTGPNSAWSKVSETVTTQGAKVVDAFTQDITPTPNKAFQKSAMEQGPDLSGQQAQADITSQQSADLAPTDVTGTSTQESLLDKPATVEMNTGNQDMLGDMQEQVTADIQGYKPKIDMPKVERKTFFENLADTAKNKYDEILDNRTFGEAVTEGTVDTLADRGEQMLKTEFLEFVDPTEVDTRRGTQGRVDVYNAPEVTYGGYASVDMNAREMEVTANGGVGSPYYQSTMGAAAHTAYINTMVKGTGYQPITYNT